MAFKPINTQEEFDQMILDRLGQAKDSVRKEYEGWKSPDDITKEKEGLQSQIEALTGEIASANEKLKTFENEIASKDSIIKAHENQSTKIRVAHEAGLSYEAVQFIQGEDEESIKASATALKSLTGSVRSPGFDPEPAPEDSKNAALKTMLKSMKGE